MPHPRSFEPLPPAGAVYYGSVPYDDTLTFYPTLRYHGLPVLVLNGWHPDSEEPLLSVAMHSTQLSPEETTEQVNERRKQLVDEGWEDGGWDGLAKYVHVDELEKIEGPPPEGPF